MVFVETPIFTRLVTEALSDEDYGVFQQALASKPDAGQLRLEAEVEYGKSAGHCRVAERAVEFG